MSLLDFQVDPERHPETFAGTVADNASVPGEQVRVVIPEFDSELAHGPCPWTPVVTPAGVWYPKAGDPCVVVQPLEGEPWIAGWTPKAGSPDASVGGADKFYQHTQSTPASVWTINHGLGKRPAVSIVDSAGTEWITEIEHVSDDVCVARFGHPFSGAAYCN